MKAKLEEVAQTYGIENWGAGYFSINKGHLVVHPSEYDRRGADLMEILEDLQRRRIHALLLRFPQILVNQMKN